MTTDKDLRHALHERDERIAKLQEQLKQQALVIAAIQRKSRIWLLPWAMSPGEVQKFAENNRKTFGAHCLIIPSSCVKAPQLMEIKNADEDQVKEYIADANKCVRAMITNAQRTAQQQRQAHTVQTMMASPALQPKVFDGAVEVPAFKKGDSVFTLPQFDKDKKRFRLPDGTIPGGQF